MPTNTTKKGNNFQLVPQTLAPSPKGLKKFSSSEKNVLERFLTEPIDCVFNENFKQTKYVRSLYAGVSSPEQAMPVFPNHQKIGASVPTLSADDERLLFERFNYARYRVYRILKSYCQKRLTVQAASELIKWGKYTLSLRSRIIEINVPLVLSMAKRSRLSGLDFNELVSEGSLALIRSAEKFDASRGFKFSTYACRAILKSFSRVAMKTSRYRGLFPVELNTDYERSDFVERKRVLVEEDCLDELKYILRSNLADLNDVEETVINERFALGALPEEVAYKTLEQVGTIIGVTKERVRQIQNKALQKIKVALEEQFLAA